MQKFGKLINDRLQTAPEPLPYEGRVYFHPRETLLKKAGYLPMRETEPPALEAGFVATYDFEERDGELLQIWRKEPVVIRTESESVTVEARLAALSAENAAIRAELSVLREARQNELE